VTKSTFQGEKFFFHLHRRGSGELQRRKRPEAATPAKEREKTSFIGQKEVHLNGGVHNVIIFGRGTLHLARGEDPAKHHGRKKTQSKKTNA